MKNPFKPIKLKNPSHIEFWKSVYLIAVTNHLSAVAQQIADKAVADLKERVR